MTFDPVIAACRFGCGLSPVVPPPDSVPDMIAALRTSDKAAEAFPVESFDTFRARMWRMHQLKQVQQKSRHGREAGALAAQIKAMRREARDDSEKWFEQQLLRRAWTDDGFRERITAFWADHFTARGRSDLIQYAVSPYVETSIRPFVAARFEDLLISAVTAPVMLNYLDQKQSIGERSEEAIARRERGESSGGLNENLAREILELHTLGVGASYTQKDVRELAELLTGLRYDGKLGTYYHPRSAEPGPETVLGKSYGGDPAELSDIHAALRDLARHPATAAHIAEKLAKHFVSDSPAPELVDAIRDAFYASGGALTEVYAALFAHPASWQQAPGNVKPPFDFMTSALRALALPKDTFSRSRKITTRRAMLDPLALMGHAWERPTGPDGLYESDSDWLTPQALAVRVQWAMRVPILLQPALPDPRKFVETALGPNPPKSVRYAAEAAENRSEGIGLVLLSPAFQRV